MLVTGIKTKHLAGWNPGVQVASLPAAGSVEGLGAVLALGSLHNAEKEEAIFWCGCVQLYAKSCVDAKRRGCELLSFEDVFHVGSRSYSSYPLHAPLEYVLLRCNSTSKDLGLYRWMLALLHCQQANMALAVQHGDLTIVPIVCRQAKDGRAGREGGR